MDTPLIAFIGGGNMASAIIGGLIADGLSAAQLRVVEPNELQRERLLQDHGVHAQHDADDRLAGAHLVVWAVKPQSFAAAAAPVAPHTPAALHLSVMAGIRSDALARALHTERIVRAMPNTPALIGQGIAGLFGRRAVTEGDRALVENVLAPTGGLLWVDDEVQLDAVTALSGSGPAYVFYFIEAMMAAAQRMGLEAEQGKTLALATFAGATELARRSAETPATLRERVTSKGGTTYAALTAMDDAGVKEAFISAMLAAQTRAKTLGDEFGA